MALKCRKQRETKERGRPLQMGRWELTEQGNLYLRLVLSSHQMNTSLHPSARIFKVYVEALTGCSHIYCPDDLNNTLISQGCILENGSHHGNCEQNICSKDRRGMEEPPFALFQLMGQLAVMPSG